MKKVMNKKGGPSMNMVVGIALGLAVIVFGYLFLSGFFTPLTEGLKTFTPEQLDVKIIACGDIFATTGAEVSFCKFTELKGHKNTYLNCNYEDIRTKLIEDDVSLSGLSCTDTPKMFCEEMKEEKGDEFNDKTTVNGETCEKLLA